MRLVSVRLPLRPLALASLVLNALLVVTGGAVRLTGSGLGCPTWPRCTDASYTTTAAMGVHGAIEFGNRLLGVVIGLVALATFIAALLEKPRRRGQARLSFALGLGVVAQGVVGGITVLTGLNPWIVGAHFVISMVMTAGAYVLWKRTAEPGAPRLPLVPGPLRTLARVTAVVSAAVILVGVVVTGSGPHAGDAETPRNGFDPTTISQVHADLVFLLIGLSVALWFALRAADAPPATVRAAGVLVLVELGQGLIGFVQYFTHLPVLLVGAHMLGAVFVWLATLAAVRALSASPAPAPATPAAEPVPATSAA
ncbi:COX15/CtaA family protein [Actinoplanes sp. NPDC089786]|uniref:COX15/CtaA family protein n=1 Tax=Actinoplanes sp. NPDC089786 TaxID=3155185 RepID=UPI003448FCEB